MNGYFDKKAWDAQRPGVWACYLTHLAIMRETHQRCPTCDLVVFEDDIIFRANFLRHWSWFVSRLPEAWAILRLGAQSLWDIPMRINKDYIHASSVSNTWGYVVRARHLKRLGDLLAALPIRNIWGIDVVLQRFTQELATFAPTVPLLMASGGCHDTEILKEQQADCDTEAVLQREARKLLHNWPLGYERLYCMDRGRLVDTHQGAAKSVCRNITTEQCCPYHWPARERKAFDGEKYMPGPALDGKQGNPDWYITHIPKAINMSVKRDLTTIGPIGGVQLCATERCMKARAVRHSRVSLGTFFREPRTLARAKLLQCKRNPHAKEPVAGIRRGATGDAGSRCFDSASFQRRIPLCGGSASQVRVPTNRAQICDNLGKAMAQLEATRFVGLSEKYQVSLCLFAALATPSTDLPVFCNCADELAWSSFGDRAKVMEQDIADPTTYELTAQELKHVDAMVANDTLLYAAAKERFERDVRAVERERRVRLLC